jgi:hypothetical protein
MGRVNTLRECDTMLKLVIYVQQLSDAIRIHSEYASLGVEMILSQDVTREDFDELRDTLIGQYMQKRGILLHPKATLGNFTLLDATECQRVTVYLRRLGDVLNVGWSEQDSSEDLRVY